MEDLEELKIPVCQGLIKPLTIAGISREAMILNVGFAASLGGAVKQPLNKHTATNIRKRCMIVVLI